MTAVTKIKRLLEPAIRGSGLISQSLSIIPTSGASIESLAALEARLPRPLSAQHRQILLAWNGLDLDVIRLFGVPPVEEGIRDILEWQELVPGNEKNIAFADSPAGFIYFEDSIGRVLSWDHDGGAAKLLAACVDVFIDDFVFGSQADGFIGGSWIQELRALGLA